MTIYLDRIKDAFEVNNYSAWTLGSRIRTPWIGNKRHDAPIEITLQEITYHEEEYKGFQIVIVGRKCERKIPLDHNGNPFVNHGITIDDSMIGSYCDPQEVITYYGYAWEITDDPKPKIEWTSDGAVCAGIGRNDGNISKTLKVVQKKLDLLRAVADVRTELIALSPVRFPLATGSRADYIPYNAVIGDQLYVQAHGRLRKGIIVATTGSRFVVGYMTPSNSTDLKYKIVPLNQLMKEKVA
jgi:hypothetical protein